LEKSNHVGETQHTPKTISVERLNLIRLQAERTSDSLEYTRKVAVRWMRFENTERDSQLTRQIARQNRSWTVRSEDSEMKIQTLNKKSFSLVTLLLTVGLCTTSLRAAAPKSDLDEYVRALESSYKGVRTLKAEFAQTRNWGNRTRTESGTVYLARGGLMRWEYHEPSAKLFVATGKDLYLYVPADLHVTHSKVKASDDVRVPFRLLLSRLNLRKVFEKIQFDEGDIKAQPGNRVLRAIPKKAEEAGYGEVWMEVTPGFDIRRLVIHYADRSRMEFLFEDIERNQPLSPNLFTFTPPPGATVVDQD